MATINRTAEKTAYVRFTATEMTPQGACGLIGNLEDESDGFWPNRLEYLCVKRMKENGKNYTDESYTAAIDSGKISCEEFLHPLPGKQYGYGLAQWTTPARKSGLWNLAHQRGVSIADLDMQLDYILQELEEKFPSVLKILKSTSSIQEASDIVLVKFESPAGADKLKESRAERGKKFYEYLKGESHMISNCGHDENGKYIGGAAGDQYGDEWALIPWYSRPWTECYYHPMQEVNDLIADLAIEAALNDCIGYDQNQRTTFWNLLKAAGYRPKNIKTKCEADCSSGVLAIAKAAGYILGIEALKNIDHTGYTGNEGSILVKAGFKKTTDSKYLTSEKYVKRGYILNYPYHHTAICVGDGRVSGSNTETPAADTTGNVAKGQNWLNSNYGNLIKKNIGALLKVDNSYGPESRKGALCVWKDVVNRKYGAKLTTNNFNFYDSCKAAAKSAQIMLGASGTLTYLAQFILSAKGYYTGAMDALFGSGTESAVKAFQKSKGLTSDGIVGPDTWYALFN